MGSNSSRPTATNSDRFGPSTILAFQPSTGFGGGIERYCEWLLTALEEGGVHVDRVALLREGESLSIVRKLKFVFTAFRMERRVRSNAPTGYSSAIPISRCQSSLCCVLLGSIHPSATSSFMAKTFGASAQSGQWCSAAGMFVP
jgi:hypothetical protein